MPESDAQPAASSAAPETGSIAAISAVDQAVISGDQSAYRAARQAQRSGKPLEPTIPDSASGEPAAQVASTDAQEKTEPASEPGKPRKNADTRVQELLTERAQLRERLAALERQSSERTTPPAKPDVKPVSSPAAPKAFPSYDDYLTEHPEASYEDYGDARARHVAREEWSALQRQQQETQVRDTVSKAVQARDQKFREQMLKATDEDPEFFDKLSPDVRALKPFDALERDPDSGRWRDPHTGRFVHPGLAAIAEEVLESDVAPQLARHLSDHPEEMHRLAALPPRELIRAIAKIEREFSAKPAAAAPKPVTDLPPPPSHQVGNRPGVPADPIDAAVATGDVAAYRAARLAQRTAAMR